MMPPKSAAEQHEQLRKLYPSLTEVQLEQASANLRRYVTVCLHIYERLLADPDALARFKALTDQEPSSTIETKRSIPTK
jgi:hypothetical protein